MKKIILPLVALSSIAFTGLASAEVVNATANVLILETVDVTETTQIDFGKLTEEDGTCTMASGGGLTGSGGQLCTGTATPGDFGITGTDGETVAITVAAGSAVDGITYNPVLANSGTTTDTATLDAASVEVIGNLVLSSATTGAKTITYTFTADYQ